MIVNIINASKQRLFDMILQQNARGHRVAVGSILIATDWLTFQKVSENNPLRKINNILANRNVVQQRTDWN